MAAENTDDQYQPPATATMAAKQNDVEPLRLLLVQRRLYSQAKRWMASRWLGMGIIAIAAPIFAVLIPASATIGGAVAALWAFLGRTTIIAQEKKAAEKAAAVQETFDFSVYGMPASGRRASTLSLEDINVISGDDQAVLDQANKDKLLNWYPFDATQDGAVSVAICQRANVSYTDRLLRSTANMWITLMVVWVIILTILCFVFDLAFPVVLLGIVLPLLPAFLDVYDYWRSIKKAARDRRELSDAIEVKLSNNAAGLETQDLMVWQNELFNLRRVAPQVPDFVYWLKRKANERAMNSAARQISGDVTRNGGN